MGLAAPAEAILYRAHEQFGLNIKHVGDMLQRLQVARWNILNDKVSARTEQQILSIRKPELFLGFRQLRPIRGIESNQVSGP